MTATARQAVPAASFDARNWPPGPARLAAAGLLQALAGALASLGRFRRLGGGLVVLDVVAQLLPWRYPRSGRSTVSIWGEALLYLTAPVAVAAAAVTTSQPWLAQIPAPLWWPAAVAVAAALVWLGGIPLRALMSGDLAFLAGVVSRPHKAAGCVSVVAAPAGEEVLFRAPLLAAPGWAVAPLGLLAGVAFVARHHLPPGLHERTSQRTLATQAAAAAALAVLTWASRSIYPALLAHYLNNVPSLLIELGRPTAARSRLAPASGTGS